MVSFFPENTVERKKEKKGDKRKKGWDEGSNWKFSLLATSFRWWPVIFLQLPRVISVQLFTRAFSQFFSPMVYIRNHWHTPPPHRYFSGHFFPFKNKAPPLPPRFLHLFHTEFTLKILLSHSCASWLISYNNIHIWFCISLYSQTLSDVRPLKVWYAIHCSYYCETSGSGRAHIQIFH